MWLHYVKKLSIERPEQIATELTLLTGKDLEIVLKSFKAFEERVLQIADAHDELSHTLDINKVKNKSTTILGLMKEGDRLEGNDAEFIKELLSLK